MKLNISLILFVFAGVLSFVPLSAGAHINVAPVISNGAQKCIIDLPNQNNRANVRTSPATTARVVGRLNDGVYVNVTKRSRGWAYISWSDQGKIKGWVNMAYVSC